MNVHHRFHAVPIVDVLWWGTVGILVGAALWPTLPQPSDWPGIDKWQHGIAYVWAGSVAWLWVRVRKPHVAVAPVAWLWVAGLGGITEILQWPLATRSASLTDWLMDLVGATLGISMMTAFRRRWSRWLPVLFGMVWGLLTPISARTVDFWPVEDVQPGMRGEGWTTVEGNRRFKFTFTTLGRLSNPLPGLDLVLIRIDSPDLVRSGVFAGMSGSPVYIQGRLLGAVAYAFPFAKEPIAGVVPFATMRKLQTMNRHLPAEPAPRPATLNWRALGVHLLAGGTGLDEWFRTFHTAVRTYLTHAESMTEYPWRPLPILWVGDPVWQDLIGKPLQGAFVQQPAAASSSSAPARPPAVRPGDGIAIPLVLGDLNLAVFGTLTAVEGNRLYAFGHQMFNLGRVQFPMYTTRVVSVVPSYQISFVLAELGQPLGTLDVDVWTGVGGRIGALPPMTELRVEAYNENQQQQFQYRMIQHPWIAPVLLQQLVTVNMATSPLGFHNGHVRLQMDIEIPGYETLQVRNVFAGLNALKQAPQFAAAVYAFLLNNPFAQLSVPRMTIRLEQSRRPIEARLKEARLLTRQLNPGDALGIVVTLIPERATPVVRNVDIRLPDALQEGTYLLMVGGSSELNRLDAQTYYRMIEFMQLSDVLHLLNRIRSNDGLYIRLIRPGVTIIRGSYALRNLPLRIYSQFKVQGVQGAFGEIPFEVVMEKKVDVPYIVKGSRQFQVEIRIPTQAAGASSRKTP